MKLWMFHILPKGLTGLFKKNAQFKVRLGGQWIHTRHHLAIRVLRVFVEERDLYHAFFTPCLDFG